MTLPVYVPILKGKEGEYAALEALDVAVRHKLMPLIEIPDVPWDYANDCAAKSLDEHIAGIPERLKRACADAPFYLDLPWFGDEETLENGQTALERILPAAVTLGLSPVPVVSRDSSRRYLKAVSEHDSAIGVGTCVRLVAEDFDDDIDLEDELNRLASNTRAGFESTDLLVDLKDLGEIGGRAALIARSLLSLVPKKERWRRLILAASSFPEDLTEVSAKTVVKLPRYEWDMWKALQRRPEALPRRDLIFGDYAMSHPVAKTLDPRTMRMSANIRYTTKDEWLILKGRGVRRYGFDQYFDLCRVLVERPEYCGRAYSWGDGYIADCAESMQGPGNATTWRKVGVNHHITLVTDGLASLPVVP